MMDWTLWTLAALALASALSCAQPVRARLRPNRTASLVWLGIAALFVGVALATYAQGASRVAEALQAVGDGSMRDALQATARSELALRVAFCVVAAMPALVLGAGFLGPRRPAPPGAPEG